MSPDAPPPGGSRRPNPLVVLLVLAVVAGLAVTAWRLRAAGAAAPNVVALSGRLEGDDAAVAPRVTGRVVQLVVREGDRVRAGDTLAVLDDDQIAAREQQARAALVQAEARVRAALEQTAVLEQQLRQVELQVEQARVDADGRVRQAEADLAAAEAQLAREQAALQIAEFDRDAYAKLASAGAVSERQGRQAASAAQQQAAAVAAALKRVDAARGGLAAARSMLTNPEIRRAQGAAIRGQLAQQQAEIASSRAQADQARARVVEAEAARKDLTVRAPFDGTVITRSAEPGEIVTPGTPLVTLVDLTRMYLRGYVPEGRIGDVKAGQAARVFLDSRPDEPIDAVVTRIDPEATFTPENTYFQEDRVKQVVGVKVQLKGAVGLAKPGMPADGQILVDGGWPGEAAR